MPCNPNSININIPPGPAGPTIPGFGFSYNFPMPNIDLNISPPDLSGLFNLLSFLLPSGQIKSALNPNYGRDIIDQIIKLLDGFMPFLMIYKFFLPLLKLILCVLEVICAIPNPKKVANALKRLFRECIPAFLNLFPLLAFIIMLISIFLLILQIISYLIILILKIIDLLIRNIRTLYKALNNYKDEVAVLAVVKKIGLVLCLLQNLFVIFEIILFIFAIIKDILSLAFAIPPCGNGDTAAYDNCCTPDVCPKFLKYGDISNTSGNLLCISQVIGDVSISFPGITQTVRAQTFQLDDTAQTDIYKQFINMINAQDITGTDKPIFYPTDGTYTGSTPPKQAPYTVDVEMYYNPANWGRNLPADGVARNIIFKNCIVTAPTSQYLINDQNVNNPNPTGTLLLSGGKGYEADGTTILYGYDSNIPQQQTTDQATLNTFLFLPESVLTPPYVLPSDGYQFSNVTYTLKPNYDVLSGKGIITIGCRPDVNDEREFTNNTFALETNGKLAALRSLQLPDLATAKDCAFLAIDGLRSPGNLTEDYVNNVFKPTIINCLQTLTNDTKEKLVQLINIGQDQYVSTSTLDHPIQFTTQPIKVTVDLKTSDNVSLIGNLPEDVAASIGSKIIPSITFGKITDFIYDGSAYFNANITSGLAGTGQLTIEYDGKVFSDIIVPANPDDPRSIETRVLNYQFIYTPVAGNVSQVGIGDTSDGAPRRDESDVSRDGNNLDGGR